MNSLHLTDDELDEILLDIAQPKSSAHLAGCAVCAERFAAFQSQLQCQLDIFNHATTAWSAARANTIDRDIAAHKPAPRITLATAWSSAVAAILAVAFAAGAHRPPAPSDIAHAPMVMPAPEAVRQNDIATDNDMLAAIDSEIVTPQPDRFGLYENPKASVPSSSSAAEQAHDE